MSDISIPGVNSKYSKMVDDLVEVEKTKLTNLEDELQTIKDEKGYWLNINRQVSTLQTAAKSLYGFENPFTNKMVDSSNERILTATADRDASFSQYSVKVIQTASNDRFLSGQLSEDFRVPPGDYTFKVGEEEVSLRYRGGKLSDFAERLNERGRNLVQATVVKNRSDSQVILLEAVPTGSANRLIFSGDSEQFAKDIEMIRPIKTDSRDILPASDKIINQSETAGETFSIQGEEIVLSHGARLQIPLDKPYPVEAGSVLQFSYKTTQISEDSLKVIPPPDPTVPQPPPASLDGVTVNSLSSVVDLPPWENPPLPERIDDFNILSVGDGSGNYNAPPLSDSDDYKVMTVQLKDLVDTLSSLTLKNNNTYRNISIKDIQVFNPTVVADYEAVNPADTARDAVLEFNGIDVVRSTNDVDDLIPGVNLSLHRASDDEVDLDIKPDAEAAKEALIEFVYKYNNLMTNILVLTTDNEEIVNEKEYFTDEERNAALEALGKLKGDMTLRQMKDRLQGIMASPYETSEGNALSLLAQMGISTNETPGGSLAAGKLRGYLEINEDKVDQVLQSKILGVRDLFGKDTDGDLILDSGVGVSLDNYLRAYSQTGGILSLRSDRLDNAIDKKDEEITDYQSYLEDYEQDLRVKYGNMESTLNQLQSSSSYLDTLSNNNNGNN
ncbi:MAG: flagellar filament capping protein FliD [Spirochaetales bacterium]|nr:flagellar filament capping protein FliD [Spirochaetales bacterium]